MGAVRGRVCGGGAGAQGIFSARMLGRRPPPPGHHSLRPWAVVSGASGGPMFARLALEKMPQTCRWEVGGLQAGEG